MKRTPEQRKKYGADRMSKAVDRIIRAQSEAEKSQGRKWVNAWAKVAKLNKVES
jgi:hypothetical protein